MSLNASKQFQTEESFLEIDFSKKSRLSYSEFGANSNSAVGESIEVDGGFVLSPRVKQSSSGGQ